MGNTEICELCETSSKRQCTDCALHLEIGIVYCSSGRSLKPSQRPKHSSTRRTVTPYQFQITSKKNPHPVVPNMWRFRTATNLLQSQGDAAESSPTQTMVGTKTSWKDGTTMINSASLCQKLGGLKSRLFRMTILQWKTTLILQQQRKELGTRKIGYSS